MNGIIYTSASDATKITVSQKQVAYFPVEKTMLKHWAADLEGGGKIKYV
jgi:hypothetical protein